MTVRGGGGGGDLAPRRSLDGNCLLAGLPDVCANGSLTTVCEPQRGLRECLVAPGAACTADVFCASAACRAACCASAADGVNCSRCGGDGACAECAPGFVASAGGCSRAAGGACAGDGDCASGACRGGICCARGPAAAVEGCTACAAGSGVCALCAPHLVLASNECTEPRAGPDILLVVLAPVVAVVAGCVLGLAAWRRGWCRGGSSCAACRHCGAAYAQLPPAELEVVVGEASGEGATAAAATAAEQAPAAAATVTAQGHDATAEPGDTSGMLLG